jgi:hypothetical protein
MEWWIAGFVVFALACGLGIVTLSVMIADRQQKNHARRLREQGDKGE